MKRKKNIMSYLVINPNKSQRHKNFGLNKMYKSTKLLTILQ